MKPKDSQSKSKTGKTESPKKPPVKYAEQYKKPNKKPNVRGNQRNWNNLKSHQLGPDFVMKKKACFNCGDFNQLTYDCRKRVKKSFTPKLVAYRPPVRQMRSNMNALAQVESRLVEYKEREVKYIEKIRTLEFHNESKNECIEILKKKLETFKLEKDGVDGKLAGLLKASKDLDNLIESQKSDKINDGLGYSVVPPSPAQLYLSPKKDLS
nr:ubiquitin hydrolase [Tanacetum cinerariifolium]